MYRGGLINPLSRIIASGAHSGGHPAGFLEFAEGHWSNALRLLKRSAPHIPEQPLINYLAGHVQHMSGRLLSKRKLLAQPMRPS